jgi:preprotein translocase subunit SecD
MRQMLVALLVSFAFCTLNAQTQASVTPACPSMEVSIVAGTSVHSTRHVSSPEGQLISLTDKPLLTIDDFTDANVSLTQGQTVLNVTMSAASAQRVQTFTANHVGTRMAFLVNGRVINMPRILDPITGKGFLIGPFRRDEAQKLADSINHRERGCGPQRNDPM